MCVVSSASSPLTPRWKAWAVLLFLYLPAWREILMPQCLRLPWPGALYFWVALPSCCCEHNITGTDIFFNLAKTYLGSRMGLSDFQMVKGQLHHTSENRMKVPKLVTLILAKHCANNVLHHLFRICLEDSIIWIVFAATSIHIWSSVVHHVSFLVDIRLKKILVAPCNTTLHHSLHVLYKTEIWTDGCKL